MLRGAAQLRAADDGPLKTLTSCPSCLPGLARFSPDTGVEAD